jgi:branched-chain amino acid transport system ATP-binding protein
MSEQNKSYPKPKLVPVPSTNIVPERDVDKRPILECRHLGVDFGGLTAVDDFNMAIGRTEIAGLIGPTARGKPRCSTCSPRSTSPPGAR